MVMSDYYYFFFKTFMKIMPQCKKIHFHLAKSNNLLLALKYDLDTFLTGSMRFTLILHIYCSF